MPTAPPRQCHVTGCPDVAVIRGRCRQHASGFYRAREQQRGSSTARGYGADWQRVREQVLQRDGYTCSLCREAGRVALAREVDHIVPLADGGERLRLAPSNLRAVCPPCHQARHRQDGRRRGG